MIAFLDALCAALLARNRGTILQLLAHPLARVLPRGVREEARAIARAPVHGHRAPIRTLRFYHQTAHLLGLYREPARRAARVDEPRSGMAGGASGADAPPKDAPEPFQYELPLPALAGR